MFVAPSITPGATYWPARNPGIRLIKYDQDKRMNLDILQYYLPLTKSNKLRRSDWLLEYTLTSGYGVPDGTARSMDLIWQRFHNSDGKLADVFMSRTLSVPSKIQFLFVTHRARQSLYAGQNIWTCTATKNVHPMMHSLLPFCWRLHLDL